MSAQEPSTGPLLELTEEFVDRCRKGQRPPLGEYVKRHPELAAEIRELFPAIAVLERNARLARFKPAR